MMIRFLMMIACALLVALTVPAPVLAQKTDDTVGPGGVADKAATGLFVRAVKQARLGDKAREPDEQLRHYKKAQKLLQRIIDDHPSSDYAVKLVLGTQIGNRAWVAYVENRIRRAERTLNRHADSKKLGRKQKDLDRQLMREIEDCLGETTPDCILNQYHAKLKSLQLSSYEIGRLNKPPMSVFYDMALGRSEGMFELFYSKYMMPKKHKKDNYYKVLIRLLYDRDKHEQLAEMSYYGQLKRRPGTTRNWARRSILRHAQQLRKRYGLHSASSDPAFRDRKCEQLKITGRNWRNTSDQPQLWYRLNGTIHNIFEKACNNEPGLITGINRFLRLYYSPKAEEIGEDKQRKPLLASTFSIANDLMKMGYQKEVFYMLINVPGSGGMFNRDNKHIEGNHRRIGDYMTRLARVLLVDHIPDAGRDAEADAEIRIKRREYRREHRRKRDWQEEDDSPRRDHRDGDWRDWR